MKAPAFGYQILLLAYLLYIVYSCPACILSPKLAGASWSPAWAVDYVLAVSGFHEGIDLKHFFFFFKRAKITSFNSLTFATNAAVSRNTKPQMFFKKLWTTVVNFSFGTWILFLPQKNGYGCTYLPFIMLASYCACQSPHALEEH